MNLFYVVILSQLAVLLAFQPSSKIISRPFVSRSNLKMIELEANTATYAGMFLVTIIPSLAFVKFIGDNADSSRDSLSDETRERFKRSMMEQPGQNFQLPTSEEEQIKQQIAKAYMQDKDVDVAVLEEKLRKRVQWRKEVMAQQRAEANTISEDEDGW
mmetsp:Transcript_24558/g.40932  ORF Transcript_24558/g.40932 Transcript_24558/m.40932 type:complete len:158 (+) Transcript_24558:73-546(+)